MASFDDRRAMTHSSSSVPVRVDLDSPSLAAGVRTLLEQAGFDCASTNGQFPSGVLVLDARAVDRRRPGFTVVALFDSLDRHLVWSALAAGALGLVRRDGPAADLESAVASAQDGHGWIAADFHEHLVDLLVTRPPVERVPEVADLTGREREVLSMLIQGRSTAEIAGDLSVAPKTVKLHASHIMQKLGVQTRAQAVALVTGNWKPTARCSERAKASDQDKSGRKSDAADTRDR